MAKEIGSEGQTRKTSAEWSASTETYPQGHRLMNTTTGEVRISKGAAGNTWATAWQPSGSSEGGGTWGSITGTLSDQTDLQNILETQANSIGAVSDEVDALPKRYKWVGAGGGNTGTEIANTIGVAITVTYQDTGVYLLTPVSGTPFTAGKTTITVTVIAESGLPFYATGRVEPDGAAAYFIDGSESAADPGGYQVIIEVEP